MMDNDEELATCFAFWTFLRLLIHISRYMQFVQNVKFLLNI